VDRLLKQVWPQQLDHDDNARLEGVARLRAWLATVGAPADPAEVGVRDAPARIQAAMSSTRGRNFIAATG
jgi:alcohol dehydrogenase YqhD (iron-dependent ADH family)